MSNRPDSGTRYDDRQLALILRVASSGEVDPSQATEAVRTLAWAMGKEGRLRRDGDLVEWKHKTGDSSLTHV
jgi:hypothetical protein